jgi:hypothetical protein
MRNPKSPFALTKTEEWVLASALEKRRVMLLDDRKPMGNTRLNIARGAKRMAR